VKILLAYVFPTEPGEHLDLAARFAATYHEYPPGIPHSTVVIANGGEPTNEMRALFCALGIPHTWFVHDDVGWDCGGFQALAHSNPDCDFMLCLGGPAYFKRRGWLARMAQVWQQSGPNLYGSLASYQVTPHIVTTGFWCEPALIRAYPKKVVTYRDRSEFEHWNTSITYLAFSLGLNPKLVTWDGEYPVQHWRTPPNIFRRGDQSNCLTYYRHTHYYDTEPEAQRRANAGNTDLLTVPFPVPARKTLAMQPVGA